MSLAYREQIETKLARVRKALERYGVVLRRPMRMLDAGEHVQGYRRRAKLVVAARESKPAAVGLFRRQDKQSVIDIPGCKVLSPDLTSLVASVRSLAANTPEELAALLRPEGAGEGALAGIDARELRRPAQESDSDSKVGILVTFILTAEKSVELEPLRQAAGAFAARHPEVLGIGVTLRRRGRGQGGREQHNLYGVTEARDVLAMGYQLVSHSSFMHVHRQQAEGLYDEVEALVSRVAGGASVRVLDLYGGTGAIALRLAQSGHVLTMVESYAPAAALAQRAADNQRLAVDVVTGDVASVGRVLARNVDRYEVVVANPPRRGLSPAARETIASLKPRALIYVACDLQNLCRDADHLARLGYRMLEVQAIDMLPLTEEVELVALFEREAPPAPEVLHREESVVVFNKPPHEPVTDRAEYPGSVAQRAELHGVFSDWHVVLETEAGTSGVCIFARDSETASRWRKAFADSGRAVYLAAARGVTPTKGAITRELRDERGAHPARTRYRRLAIGGGHSILRVVPEKRHVHQIRRHLAAVNHPVLGDARYGHGPTNRYFEEKHGLDRSFLHLVRVELDHPDSGQRMLVEAPLPPDLRSALTRASDETVLEFLQNKRALGSGGVQLRGSVNSSLPPSERSPLSVVETPGERSLRAQALAEQSQNKPLELDEAPRTVRGELLNTDDENT